MLGFRIVVVGLMLLASSQEAAAQLRATKLPRSAAASSTPPRFDAPSVWRNQPQEPAAVRQPLKLSKQDRKAYENCPDPKKFGPKPRRRMVRIW